MKILKFGGTSVGTAESLANVRTIIEQEPQQCVVVVSALGGVTDMLLKAARLASGADSDYEKILAEIDGRHHAVAEAVIRDPEARRRAIAEVESLLGELATIFKAIYLLGELTARSSDLIVSYGERMSCQIVHGMVEGSALAHSLDFIRTRDRYGKEILDEERTSELTGRCVKPLLESHRVIIAPGFISRGADGRITNLGRGGSDYTAAILAAELGAGVLEIWTDVSGFMTADPRLVGNARIIDRLTFVEAMELCNFGAKVVYPPTIYPVFHRNIPIVIKNTFRPKDPGTLISEAPAEHTETGSAIGISAIADTCLIDILTTDENLGEQMINALAGNGIETLLVTPGRCGVRGADAGRAREILEETFAVEKARGVIPSIRVTERLAMLAIATRKREGDDGADTVRLSREALEPEGIPIVHGPQQAAPGTVACMVAADALKQAINSLHAAFIEGIHDTTTHNIERKVC